MFYRFLILKKIQIIYVLVILIFYNRNDIFLSTIEKLSYEKLLKRIEAIGNGLLSLKILKRIIRLKQFCINKIYGILFAIDYQELNIYLISIENHYKKFGYFFNIINQFTTKSSFNLNFKKLSLFP